MPLPPILAFGVSFGSINTDRSKEKNIVQIFLILVLVLILLLLLLLRLLLLQHLLEL